MNRFLRKKNQCERRGGGKYNPNMLLKQPSLLFVHMLMLLCSVLVSTSFTVGAAITDGLDPVILTLFRFSFAAFVFSPWIYYKYGFQFSFTTLLRCGVISFCLVVFFCAMFLSLRYTSALNTSVIFALVPSMSFVFSFVLVRERLAKWQLVALGLGVAGVVWVIFGGELGKFLAMEWNRGDLIFLGGCGFLSLYTPLVRLLHQGEPMAVMTFWILVTGALWLLLFGSVRITSIDFSTVPLFVWGGVVYLAVFTTIITFFLTQYSVLYLGPTKVASYSYLYPALVLLTDLLLGHGLPPLRVFPGVFAVLVVMVVLMRVKENS